jgi:hypothetical protein
VNTIKEGKYVRSTKFGSEDRFHSSTEKLKVPGPGQYNFEDLNTVKEATPNVKFGTSSRGELSKERARTPGPGAYERKDIVGNDGPSKSMGLKPT